jgi:hypothetical protein
MKTKERALQRAGALQQKFLGVREGCRSKHHGGGELQLGGTQMLAPGTGMVHTVLTVSLIANSAGARRHRAKSSLA